jgi:hypothetical protein
MIYIRINTTKNGKEQVITYAQESNLEKTIKFQADNNVAWQYLFYTSSTAPKTHWNKLINAYVDAGFEQHSFAGGFDEATKRLTI